MRIDCPAITVYRLAHGLQLEISQEDEIHHQKNYSNY